MNFIHRFPSTKKGLHKSRTMPTLSQTEGDKVDEHYMFQKYTISPCKTRPFKACQTLEDLPKALSLPVKQVYAEKHTQMCTHAHIYTNIYK